MTTRRTIETDEGMLGYEALSQALAYAQTVRGRMANLVEIIANPDCLYDGKLPYTPLSEEIVGIDKYGKYTEQGGVVFVTIHGLGVLTPDNMRIANRVGYYGNHSANIDRVFPNQDVLSMMFNEGSLPDGRNIEVMAYRDYSESGLTDYSLLHAVVRTRQEATYPDFSRITDLPCNPQIVTYCGGRSRTANLFDAWKRKGQGAFHTRNILFRPKEYFANGGTGRLLATVANPIYGPCDGFYGNWPLSQYDKGRHRYLILSDLNANPYN
jgi:hypothetical protein